MQDFIQILIAEFRDKLNQKLIARDIVLPRIPGKIEVLIGMRRTGKTSFLFQKIHELLQSGESIESILYLNFEDDRLLPADASKLSEIIDSFYSLFPENHNRLCHLFLDEIQNVEGWALVIRRIFDSRKVKIYLAGSSAKLLSKEIATSLRGRSVSIEVWPYSFQEYLRAKKISIEYKIYGQAVRDNVNKHLLEYLNCGGFPEVVTLEQGARTQILQDYVDVVTFRDIVERHGITNIILIKYLIRTLLGSHGRSMSVHKIFNDLKSQGIKVSKNSLHEYIGHINDVYLAFTVPLYSESMRKVHSNPRKIYAVDTGIVRAFDWKSDRDLGSKFENLVYLYLRRQGNEVYYYLTEKRYEVDFLTVNRQGEIKLYQACYNASDNKTRGREERALRDAEQELDVKGELITMDNFFLM
ncbi:MAG: ATP-binding protein [Thermodesulfobacteriota bacterium]|nr:ATP-binding protein [Thermodesulfobacteriota bacterium]